MYGVCFFFFLTECKVRDGLIYSYYYMDVFIFFKNIGQRNECSVPSPRLGLESSVSWGMDLNNIFVPRLRFLEE